MPIVAGIILVVVLAAGGAYFFAAPVIETKAKEIAKEMVNKEKAKAEYDMLK